MVSFNTAYFYDFSSRLFFLASVIFQYIVETDKIKMWFQMKERKKQYMTKWEIRKYRTFVTITRAPAKANKASEYTTNDKSNNILLLHIYRWYEMDVLVAFHCSEREMNYSETCNSTGLFKQTTKKWPKSHPLPNFSLASHVLHPSYWGRISASLAFYFYFFSNSKWKIEILYGWSVWKITF